MPDLPPSYDDPSALRPATTDAAGHRRYGDIEFARVLGHRPLRMDLTVPGDADGEVPVVVWVHGGAFMLGSRLWGPVTDLVTTNLLGRGLAVAAFEYRLSGEAVFPACLHDVKAAVRWLRRFGPGLGVRADSIGAWGESAGGHLAAFLGLNNDDDALCGTIGVTGVGSHVQTAVAWYPPTDFLRMDEQSGPHVERPHDAPNSPESRLVGGAMQEHPQAAAWASPLTHAGPSAAPMLLVHGEVDPVVPCEQSRSLEAALRDAGADCELVTVLGAGHVFDGVDPAPLAERSADFLRHRLAT